MTLRFDRGLPPAVALALLGGVLGLGALLLPWYSLNAEAVKTFMHSLTEAMAANGFPSAPNGTDLNTTIDAGMPSIVHGMEKELVGYKVFKPISVGLHALAAAGGIFAALKAWSGETNLQQQRGELLGAAAIVAFRPILAIVRQPGAGAGDGVPGITIPDNMFGPGPGIFVALAGAALLLAAALMAKGAGATAPAADWATPTATPGGAYVPGAPPATPAYAATPAAPAYAAAVPQPYMPGTPQPYAPGPAQPAPAYMQPAPSAYAAAVPQPYAPGNAYGDEGPATLDRDSRLRRPSDPDAPPPLAAPAVPIMPVPAQVTPIHDHAPVNDRPGNIYGVPSPEAQPTHPPQRTGSTAPPGFG